MDKILEQLRTAGKDILETDEFVHALEESKNISNEAEKQLKAAKKIDERIDESREKFKVASNQATRLYFAVQDLQQLDNMYKFSMSWIVLYYLFHFFVLVIL